MSLQLYKCSRHVNHHTDYFNHPKEFLGSSVVSHPTNGATGAHRLWRVSGSFASLLNTGTPRVQQSLEGRAQIMRSPARAGPRQCLSLGLTGRLLRPPTRGNLFKREAGDPGSRRGKRQMLLQLNSPASAQTPFPEPPAPAASFSGVAAPETGCHLHAPLPLHPRPPQSPRSPPMCQSPSLSSHHLSPRLCKQPPGGLPPAPTVPFGGRARTGTWVQKHQRHSVKSPLPLLSPDTGHLFSGGDYCC